MIEIIFEIRMQEEIIMHNVGVHDLHSALNYLKAIK